MWGLGTKCMRSSLDLFTVIFFVKAAIKCSKPCVLHFATSFQRHLIYTKLVFSPPNAITNRPPCVSGCIFIYFSTGSRPWDEGVGGWGRSSRSLDKGRGAVSPPQFFRPFGPQFVSAFLKRWQGESLSRFSFGFMFSLMLSVSLPKCDSKFFFLCNYVIVMPNRKGTMLLIHLDSQKGFKCTNWQKQN